MDNIKDLIKKIKELRQQRSWFILLSVFLFSIIMIQANNSSKWHDKFMSSQRDIQELEKQIKFKDALFISIVERIKK